MKLDFACLTEEGIKTSVNQDYYTAPRFEQDVQKKGWLFTICDGVGGYAGGDIASRTGGKMFNKDYYDTSGIEDISHWLNDEIIKINRTVLEMGKEDPKLQGMATTIVSLLILDDMAYINNVGDSRIYLVQKNSLEQITEDHSVVWEYYIRNIITKNEIIESNIKHLITEAIGLNYFPRINSYKIPLPKEFTFLLCSDGLTDVLVDDKIEEILKIYSEDMKTCTKELHQLALKNSARDDVTIILVKNRSD
ncbi:MAG: protein phosphatase 2C domain-containing protein [Candidatus Cloacimonadales bacterium]|nr:protein phosphatase 2C domain-containing protein [Candidatus Cloacimonadales bacterium]